MCTLVILRRPQHHWPLLVAGNRDEMADRPWRPPARHWEDRLEVVAGLDELGGGSWFGVNDYGLVAVVMNREGTLGSVPGMRSRGELVLEALDHSAAAEAARALEDLEPSAYRGFNLLVGDPVSAFWLRHRHEPGAGRVEVRDVPPGLHMLTAQELDDESVARVRSYLPRFRAAGVPEPGAGDWRAWQSLLASRQYPEGDEPTAAMNFSLPGGFGTLCSHLVAIPRHPAFQSGTVFLFAGGPPDQAAFVPVAM